MSCCSAWRRSCAYAFLAAQSPPASAAAFVTAFFGASVLPVYGVFLMPEIFNFTLVFVAYFLWLYKEVAPGRWLDGRWSDLAAAVLLGIATYSKPIPTQLLVAPLVILFWTAQAVDPRLHRRPDRRGDGVRVFRVHRAGVRRVQLPGRRSQDLRHGSFPFESPARDVGRRRRRRTGDDRQYDADRKC